MFVFLKKKCKIKKLAPRKMCLANIKKNNITADRYNWLLSMDNSYIYLYDSDKYYPPNLGVD